MYFTFWGLLKLYLSTFTFLLLPIEAFNLTESIILALICTYLPFCLLSSRLTFATLRLYALNLERIQRYIALYKGGSEKVAEIKENRKNQIRAECRVFVDSSESGRELIDLYKKILMRGESLQDFYHLKALKSLKKKQRLLAIFYSSIAYSLIPTSEEDRRNVYGVNLIRNKAWNSFGLLKFLSAKIKIC